MSFSESMENDRTTGPGDDRTCKITEWLRHSQSWKNAGILSFDSETDGKGERLFAISLYSNDINKVIIVDGATGRCMDNCGDVSVAVLSAAISR